MLISASRTGLGPRLAVLAGLLIGLVVLFFVVLPLAVALLIVFALFLVSARIRRWWRSLRDPNGPMDGRRNVRVVRREET